MLRLLFFMNLTGFIFFILCTILFPYKKDFLPSKVRIFIYRLNMIFFIIPFPLFLPYLRRFFKTTKLNIPFDPSLKNGSHIAIRFIDDVYLILPKPTLILISILLLWMISSICLYIINSRDQIKFKRFHRTFDLFMDEKLINGSINASDLVQKAMKEMNISREIKIYILHGLHVPHVTGIFHLKLFLPANWDVSEQIYYITIKHEMAHILHKDLPFQFLVLIACSIHGLNPIVHILKTRIQSHEEIYADACSCTNIPKDERLAFANALIDLSATANKPLHVALKGLGFQNNKRLLEQRVYHIVKNDYKNYKPTKSAFVCLISIIIFILSALPAISYNLPAALASNNDVLEFETIDNFSVDVLSSENTLESLTKSTQFLENELYSLLNTFDFSKNDTYCVDKNGNIYDVSSSYHEKCNHIFIPVDVLKHEKNTDTSCNVAVQKAQRCTKCGDIKIIKNYTSTTFINCPH